VWQQDWSCVVIGRLARAGATVAIAGALVFAVPISAQAGLLDPLTLAPYAIGAVRAAAPVEAAAGVIGPEGTLLVTTAVVLGALAYATKDTWMPWVSGLLGAGGLHDGKSSGGQYQHDWVVGDRRSGVTGVHGIVYWHDVPGGGPISDVAVCFGLRGLRPRGRG